MSRPELQNFDDELCQLLAGPDFGTAGQDPGSDPLLAFLESELDTRLCPEELRYLLNSSVTEIRTSYGRAVCPPSRRAGGR